MDTALEILIRPYQPADRQACRSLWAELTQQHRDLYHDGVYPQWSFLEIR